MLLVSCLPIFLHPVIAFGLIGGMNDATILSIVLSGRIIKYLVMAKVAVTAPHLLRCETGRIRAHAATSLQT